MATVRRKLPPASRMRYVSWLLKLLLGASGAHGWDTRNGEVESGTCSPVQRSNMMTGTSPGVIHGADAVMEVEDAVMEMIDASTPILSACVADSPQEVA